MRNAEIKRQTGETEIKAYFSADGTGVSEISTGIGFFDHMLTLFAKHGFFDLRVHCSGDLIVDGHHTVEDIGIVLGQAISKAIGDKAGMRRYGTSFVPMDETLALVSLDVSGRPYLVFEAEVPAPMIGGYDSELTEEFFRAVSVYAGLTLHIKLLHGRNSHHIVEAIFKAFGRALGEAVQIDPRIRGVMSTKGAL